MPDPSTNPGQTPIRPGESQAGGARLDEAVVGSTITRENLFVPAHERFNLTEVDTSLATEYSLTMAPYQSVRDIFGASDESYARLATDKQKELIRQAIFPVLLDQVAGVDKPIIQAVAERYRVSKETVRERRDPRMRDLIRIEEGYVTISLRPMITDSTCKALDQQLDPRTGRLIFVNSEEVYGVPRLLIAAVAALKLVKSVSEGILVTPGEPAGDALEGKWSRALGGSFVWLSSKGILTLIWPGVSAKVNIGCAGTGSSRRNS